MIQHRRGRRRRSQEYRLGQRLYGFRHRIYDQRGGANERNCFGRVDALSQAKDDAKHTRHITRPKRVYWGVTGNGDVTLSVCVGALIGF